MWIQFVRDNLYTTKLDLPRTAVGLSFNVAITVILHITYE